MEQVRSSVVRICFDWKKKNEVKTMTMTMVIPGVILLIDNGEATIAANSTFFKNDEVLNCMVNFPNAAGYEDGLHLPKELVANGEIFSTFTLRPSEHGYITPHSCFQRRTSGNSCNCRNSNGRITHLKIRLSLGRISRKISLIRAEKQGGKWVPQECIELLLALERRGEKRLLKQLKK